MSARAEAIVEIWGHRHDPHDTRWTPYEEATPMWGRAQRGSVYHAVLQSDWLREDGVRLNACTRRTLCGALRGSVLLAFPYEFGTQGGAWDNGKVCPKCSRLIEQIASFGVPEETPR